jgi:hypothetical protein
MCFVLCALFVTSSVTPAGAQTGSASIPVPTQIHIEQDDRVATLSWNGFPHWGADNPTGVYGYQIQWGAFNSTLTTTVPSSAIHISYVESPIIQLQPLTNGQQYQAVIRAIDAYGRLSNPAPPVTFTGSSARVDALRKQMNGFFDDFNLPAGPVDELKWNTAVSYCNDPAKNGFFINDQFHAHSMLGDKYGDRGQIVSRPRVPLLIGGRTATITFDFDGAFRRDFWYLDILPVPLDITNHINLETEAAYPGNMLRIRETGNVVSLFWIDATGNSNPLNTTHDLMDENIKLVHNVRRHWKVTVSQSLVQVFIDGQLVASGAVAIPWTVGYIDWSAFSYNTSKENVPDTLMHWDNFGFDAPASWTPASVVHNYRTIPSDGSEYAFTAYYNLIHTTIQIPDKLTGATQATLLFTMQPAASQVYIPGPLDTVTINGISYPIPQFPAIPAMMTSNGPYAMNLPIPLSGLKTGTNTITYGLYSGGVLNEHIEVVFPAGTKAPYTDPSDVGVLMGQPPLGMPAFPPVGVGCEITQMSGNPLWPELSGTAAEAATRPVAASGVVTFLIHVDGDIALHSVGKTPGFVTVQLLVDRQVVATQLTNLQVPALGGDYTVTLNTASLTNGRHEVFAQAISATGVASTPDYFAANDGTGDYYPLIVNVSN